LAAADALAGVVCEAAQCADGSAVLEGILFYAGTEDSAFIARELCAEVRSIVGSPCVSSVLCRLFEFSAASEGAIAIADTLLSSDVALLCCNRYGREVAMSILSNSPEARHRHAIIQALASEIHRFARHRFASEVVVQVLTQCSQEECQVMTSQLMGGGVADLACHNFGVHVVRAMMEQPGLRTRIVNDLSRASKRLMKDKYGRALLQELGTADQAAPSAFVGGA